MPMPRADYTGVRFGRAVGVRAIGPGPHGKRLWLWRCDCGNEFPEVRHKHLGCGCAVGRTSVHGMSHTPEHEAWAAMRKRCENPRHAAYPNYGGRGVRVCQRWQSFENFYEDMGSRPSPLHSLDRVDNDGGYEPANCRWATKSEQASNRRLRRRSADGSWA